MQGELLLFVRSLQEVRAACNVGGEVRVEAFGFSYYDYTHAGTRRSLTLTLVKSGGIKKQGETYTFTVKVPEVSGTCTLISEKKGGRRVWHLKCEHTLYDRLFGLSFSQLHANRTSKLGRSRL